MMGSLIKFDSILTNFTLVCLLLRRYGRRAATVGSPGPVAHLGISRACSLRCAVPMGISTTTASHGRPDRRHGNKEIVVVAPVLVHGRVRGLDAYLWLLNALRREYRPHHPPAPALSISNSAARGAKETESGWRHYEEL